MRVLLAVDQSPASDAAAAYLIGLPFDPARRSKEIVTVDPPFPFVEGMRPDPRRMLTNSSIERTQQVEATLTELVARFKMTLFTR
ncbi:MAG: hypothetical protein R3C56_39390 [Pirellulaceae bacterium]